MQRLRGGIPVTIPPGCLCLRGHTVFDLLPFHIPALLFCSAPLLCHSRRRGQAEEERTLERRRLRAHLAMAVASPSRLDLSVVLQGSTMDGLDKYRSSDGFEDDKDWSEFLSLGMQMFQSRLFNVFCVASCNEEHLVCSLDIHLSVDGGMPLNSSGSSEERGDSKIFVLSEQQPLAPLVLVLWLDSGATHHAVGDARILCNLRDPPAGTAVRAADGVRLLVQKIGDIQTQYIKIQDVYLVLGLRDNLISVRQLAKEDKIVTIFYENYAELWREGKQVGGAIADNATSLYRLCYLTTPTEDPEAGTSRYIREEVMDVATARGATSTSNILQLLSLSTSMSTKSKMIAWDMQQQRCLKQREDVFQCRTCGRCFPTFQALGGHRTSHKRVPANDRDLLELGARSGKGAAKTVHRCYFTGEVFPTVQALCRHRAAFHVSAGDSRWPFNIGDSRRGPADYSETSLADGERRHSSGEQRTVVPGVVRGETIAHRTTSYPACPMCMSY